MVQGLITRAQKGCTGSKSWEVSIPPDLNPSSQFIASVPLKSKHSANLIISPSKAVGGATSCWWQVYNVNLSVRFSAPVHVSIVLWQEVLSLCQQLTSGLIVLSVQYTCMSICLSVRLYACLPAHTYHISALAIRNSSHNSCLCSHLVLSPHSLDALLQQWSSTSRYERRWF